APASGSSPVWPDFSAVRTRPKSGYATSALDERQEVCVERVLMGLGVAVVAARVDLERRVRDQAAGEHRRCAAGNDLVVVAVRDERRHVALPAVLGVVDLRELADAVELPLEAAEHSLQPERVADALGELRALAVVPVEGHDEVLVELAPVVERAFADRIEHR